jgi:anti-sigma B factor antagonist
MTLQLQKSQATPDIWVLALSGRLLMGNDSRNVELAFSELLLEGVKKVVADITRLESLDSTGVGILVVCHGRIQKAGGALRIASSPGIVHDALMMTHVDKLIRFFPSAEEATKNFEVP